MSNLPTYESIRERLEELTDPERSTAEQILSILDQDEATLAISEIRQGVDTLRKLISVNDPELPHRKVMAERMTLAVAGAEAAAKALLDEYAVSLHEIITNCHCSYCQAARAYLN